MQKLVLCFYKYGIERHIITPKAFILGNHKGYRQSWTNQNYRDKADPKHGKTRASELRLILVPGPVHTTRRNLKKVLLWKRISYFPSTLRQRNLNPKQ